MVRRFRGLVNAADRPQSGSKQPARHSSETQPGTFASARAAAIEIAVAQLDANPERSINDLHKGKRVSFVDDRTR